MGKTLSEDEHGTLSFSQEWTVGYPKNVRATFISSDNYERLMRMISRLNPPTRWFERLGLLGFSALGVVVALAFTIPELQGEFTVASVSFVVLIILFLALDDREKKRVPVAVEDVLEFANEVKVEPREPSALDDGDQSVAEPGADPKIQSLPSWEAHTQPQVSQGVDFHRLELSDDTFHQVGFKVRSDNPYLRAGIKFEKADAAHLPALVTAGSVLFHIGRTDETYGWAAYKDRERADGVSSFPVRDDGFVILAERLGPVLRFVVNQTEVYRVDVGPEYLSHVSLAAWGDGHDFDVSFDPIYFKPA